MALRIDSVNLEPNRQWYVRLHATSNVTVSLHLTQEQAVAGEWVIAIGYINFGTAVPVILQEVGEMQISTYNNEVLWHFLVSGQSGDGTKIFKVGPFTDLDDVSHAVYRNPDIIPYRAAAEVNRHTHLEYAAQVELATIPFQLRPGHVMTVSSTFTGESSNRLIKGINISLTPDSMTSSVSASRYEQVTR